MTTGTNGMELLQLLFLGLKLTGYIDDWSWWSVMAPTIASLIIVLLIIGYKVVKEVNKNGRD